MSKESPNSPYSRLIFREPFRSEAETRKQASSVTDVIFADGKGIFNGTTSKINYNLRLNGTYSVRIKLNSLTLVANTYFVDFRTNNGIGYVAQKPGEPNNVGSPSGVLYVDGSLTTILTTSSKEIICSGITIDCLSFFIGSYYTGAAGFKMMDLDLLEIYQGTLTASEVANLYNNTWNKEVSGYGGQFIGSDVVTNGDFSNGSTDWTLGAGWTVSGGKANWSASGIAALTQANKFVTGKRYILSFTVSGNDATRIGLTNSGLSTTSYTIGTHNLLLTNVTTGALTFYGYSGSDLPFSLDNISLTVQEFQPDLLLDFDSTQGTIKDRTGKNTLTPTDVSIKKIGQSYSADFNGSTSLINTGSDIVGIKSITVCGWVNPRKWNASNYSILSNFATNGFVFRSSTVNRAVVIAGGTAATASNYIMENTWNFIAYTCTSAGIVNFYGGNLSTAPSISGTANQSVAPLTAGTTNIIIGNNSEATRTFDGSIPMLKFYEGILSLEDITQIWSSTRGKFI